MKSSAMTKAYIGVMVGLVCSVGCVPSQATGPLFTPSDTVDSKRSVVYVYFPHTTASNALYQGLVINGELKSRLDYGGYYVFVSPRGVQRLRRSMMRTISWRSISLGDVPIS